MNTQLAILSVEYLYERVAFRVLFALLGVALLGYLYFVGASVMNIIERKEASHAAAALQGSIAGLEKQYFALSESITPQNGAALGLAPLSNADYVYRPGATASAENNPDTIDRNAI
jgi:hypothetical protein